jgi:hypothetical protein
VETSHGWTANELAHPVMSDYRQLAFYNFDEGAIRYCLAESNQTTLKVVYWSFPRKKKVYWSFCCGELFCNSATIIRRWRIYEPLCVCRSWGIKHCGNAI